MTSRDVGNAVAASGRPPMLVRIAIEEVLPILRELIRGRVWYVRLGANVLIRALEDYVKDGT